MVERRTELTRRYHRKEKLRKLKAKLQAASGADRDKILYKIHRLSPFWTEASLTQGQTTAADPTKGEGGKEAKKKAPPKPKAEKKPAAPQQ